MIGYLVLFLSFSCNAFVYHSFDGAMHVDSDFKYINHEHMLSYVGYSARYVYDFFKQLYEQQLVTKKTDTTATIPKIIHQIWIGKSLPPAFYAFQETCKRLHPDWEYRLWTQDTIHTLHLKNTQYIMQSRNPGEISDLLRYEILYQHGGVYLDCDIECLSALDELHVLYDLYVGLQPLDTGYVQLGIGVIGARPGHPLIKSVIDGIGSHWHDPEYAQMATMRTGPLYFTRKFIEYYQTDMHCDEKNIALPAFYFYPLGSVAQDVNRALWQNVGVYTIHHWAKSWLLPCFRRPQFQELE